MPVTAASPRILIVRLGAVGDVVRTLPLAHALRSQHPSAWIGWAVEEPSAGLLAEVSAIDDVHVLRRRTLVRQLARPWHWMEAAAEWARFRSELAAGLYDLALDVHGTLKAALVTRASRAEKRVGFAPGGSKEGAWLLYDVAHPFPARPMTRIRRAIFLAQAEGLLGPEAATGEEGDARIDFGLRFDEGRVDAITRYACLGLRPFVVLFPFASAAGREKRWAMDRHVELGRRLARRGARAVLAWGSPREREEVDAALRAASAEGEVQVAPPTDLVELSALLQHADLLVTGDTGPMHVAAAVGTRVLALFGPTDPVVNHPWGPGHRVLVRRPLSALSVDEVETAATAMLAEERPRPA